MRNRRDFLKILGTGMAVATASPVIASVSKLKAPGRTLKVGVLSPQSNLCPQYPYSFMNGLRMGIDQHKALKKQHIEIVNEPNGYGTPFLSKQNAQKLLYENNVDLMVGILGNEVVGQFEDMFSKKQVPFIVCNAGEYYPVKPLQDNPFLLFNTLNLYQSSYMTGKYATSNYGKKGFVVTSLYDSGYDSTYAFTQGVTSCNGTVETLVMKSNEKDFASTAIARIRESSPDYIFVLLSGVQASDFIIRYKSETEKPLPLLTTPFVTENNNLPMIGDFANELGSISPWDKNVSNKVNKEFCKTYLETYRSEPDMFAALGFETGMMIYRALVACNGSFDGQNLRSCLSKIEMDSPRGTFSVDNKAGWTRTPLYKLQVSNGVFSTTTRIEDEMECVDAFHNDFASLDTPLRSGWFNPYMFV